MVIRAIVIHHQIMRDPIQPRRERSLFPAIVADALPCLEENLRGQFLGLGRRTDFIVNIFVDFIYELVVESRKRLTIAPNGLLYNCPFVI